MTDQELLDLNRQGFLPGPNETEEQFLGRVAATQNCFANHPSIPKAHFEWSKHHLLELFGFAPESLIAFYSNAHLAPWQGAACWMHGDLVAKLQLREGFRKGRYLGLYSREEVLAHESAHAARVAFEEPENEEFFAYGTSEKSWRRVLGPIVKNSWEVWVLCLLLGVGLFWEGGIVASLGWISAGLYRLARQHIRRANAAKTLLKQGKDAAVARAILFRLTDAEIRQLAKAKQLVGDDTLRWRLLRLLFSFERSDNFHMIGSRK